MLKKMRGNPKVRHIYRYVSSAGRKVASRIEDYRVQRERASLDIRDKDAEIVATPELELWPTELRDVRALISCGCGLYLLEDLHVRKLAHGFFFGLTRHKDQHFIFLRHSRQEGSIYRFKLDNGQVTCCERLFADLSGGVHQMDFIDDKLFVPDTYRNEIVILDRNGRPLRRLYPLGKLTPGMRLLPQPNYGHLNSVYATKDSIFVLAHHNTYKTGRRSEILVLRRDDFSLVETVTDVGSCAHNIVVRDGLFLVCDSFGGTLQNHGKVVFEPSMFTRGLALNDDFVIVGGSVYSERGDRLSHDVFVYFLTRGFELVATLKIKNAGQVNEIRLLSNDYGLSNTR